MPTRTDPADPPSNWAKYDVTRLTDTIYYGWFDGQDDPKFWHWCPTNGVWAAAGTRGHQVLSRDPLHLEPSLLWRCCDTHGFVRNGQWIPA